VNVLLALQRRFQAAVLAARPGDATAIAGPALDDAEARLAIYANAYRLRLVAALREDYPKMNALIGEEAFDALARAYIARHPSRHPNIRWAGVHLPAFLGEEAPYQSEPVLAELAAFEQALRDAFDADDAAVLTVCTVAAIPPERWVSMRPVLHPSLHRLEFAWNAVAIWQALDRGEAAPRPQRVKPPVAWVVWRKGLNPHFRSLAPGEARALDAVRDGADVQTVCEQAGGWAATEDIPGLVAGWFAGWVADGMITAVRTDCP
jgi:hypothetical protein